MEAPQAGVPNMLQIFTPGVGLYPRLGQSNTTKNEEPAESSQNNDIFLLTETVV
jgi:hypothetical protein